MQCQNPMDHLHSKELSTERYIIPGRSIAYSDAGAALTDEDYLSGIKKAPENIFEHDSLQYPTKEYSIELKPLFSAFGWKSLAQTSLRSFLMCYLLLLEPRSNVEEDDDDFLQDAPEEHHVDLVAPFKKSVVQIIRELETLNGEGKLQQPESPVHPKMVKSEIAMDAKASGCDDSGSEEIIRELKKIQKQNCITHCLLSVMIALTVAWQVSEFTLVFKLKNGLSQPFKSIGSMLTGMIKGPMETPQIAVKVSDTKQQQKNKGQ